MTNLNIEDVVSDHENRIRKLEQSSLEIKYELLSISKAQSEFKTDLLKLEKSHKADFDNFFNKIVSMVESNITTNNKQRLIDRKEVWGLVSLIVGVLINHYIG